MKGIILFLMFSGNAHALITQQYYKVTSQTMWKCPDGYSFSEEDRLCYPPQKQATPGPIADSVSVNDEVNTSQAATEKHIKTDKATVNIYNYNGGGKVDMPPMDIVGVKRRKELDKKAVHKAIDDVLEGKFYQEEDLKSDYKELDLEDE